MITTDYGPLLKESASPKEYEVNYIQPSLLKGYYETVHRLMHAHKWHMVDTIVVRGASGLMMAGPVAIGMGIPPTIIRKAGSHGHALTGPPQELVETYILLDDFISGGGTVRALYKGARERYPHAVFLGGIFYRHGEADSAQQLERYYR